MLPEFPHYDEDGEEDLFFPNIWRNIDPQEISGVDCFTPFANVNNGLNRFVMDITGIDFRRMLSALYLGAEIAYPQEFMQIVLNFLKMVHCPIDFEEECQEYPTYTPIIQYAPMNPFMNPDEVPEGYLVPPFVFVSEENIAEYGDYEIGDVIVPIDAITLDLDWFETLDGQLPTITINVEGEGKISMKLLTVPFGGVAIITLDNPPDLLDILAGIITGSDNILDVNRDIVSIPPETTEHVSYEIEVTGAGMHTIYIVFLPVLDDSLIPVRFGGGLRSIELCDFGEVLVPYVEDIRYDDGDQMLQYLKAGTWHDVTDFGILMNDYILAAQIAIGEQAAINASQESQLTDLSGDIINHDTRITILEGEMDAVQALQATHDTSIANLSTDMEAVEDAVDALDARLDALENAAMWVETWDFETSDFSIIPTNATYTGGQGFVHTQGSGDVVLQSINTGAQANQIDTYEVGYLFNSGETGAPTNVSEQRLNSISPYANIHFTGNGNTGVGFIRVPNNPTVNAELQVQDFGSYTIKYIKFYGRGDNPF